VANVVVVNDDDGRVMEKLAEVVVSAGDRTMLRCSTNCRA